MGVQIADSVFAVCWALASPKLCICSVPQPVDMRDLLEFVRFEGIRAIPRSCALDANSLKPWQIWMTNVGWGVCGPLCAGAALWVQPTPSLWG